MEVVIDAGIVFTALTGKGITKELIFSDFLIVFSPEYLFEEVEEHMPEIIALSSASPEEVGAALSMLKSKIRSVPKEEFDTFLEQANALMPDKEDTEYLALSLAKGRTPIWSNDGHFKKQTLVEVFTTKELVDKLKSLGFITDA